MLRFRTLGAIDLRTEEGNRVAALLGQPKRLALLAVLSARPQDELVRREELVSLLWPGHSPSSGRSALNTTLTRLRGDLGEEIFQGTAAGAIGLSPIHFCSDVQQFLEAIDGNRHRRAAELYRGPFLAEFGLSGNRAFEEWLDDRRSRLRRQAYRAAFEAAEQAQLAGELEEAERAYRRALDIDPLQEEAAAGLIRVLDARSRPSVACRVYEAFRERGREELDLPPSEELEHLIDEIREPTSVPDGREDPPDEPGGADRRPAPPEPEPTYPESDQAASGAGGRDPTLSSPGVLAVVLLFVAAAGGIGAYTLGGPEAGNEPPSERTIAVLPFHVAGSADRSWENGMVTALSTSLDGVGQLRAIADRTVLATWEQVSGRRTGTTRDEALSVARNMDARYAVIGSVVELGSTLRFNAELLHTESGGSLGQVEVRGPADSAAALSDELARRVIGVLEEHTDEAVRRAEVASLNTHSVEALKAYLEGERNLRRGEAEAAMDHFQEAIRADSSFALPYARLGLYGFWREEGTAQATHRAYELSSALPPRDRRLIRALYLVQVEHRTLTARDSFRQLSRDYPDDPSVWSSLGEFVFHTNIAGGISEVEAAHERAVALDPGHTAYYDHYVGPAFTLHHDSALAADRIGGMPDSEWKRMYGIALDLVFGDPAVRERAWNRVDTMDIHEPWLAFGPLEGPEEKATLDTLLRRLIDREDLADASYAPLLLMNDLHRGRLQQARVDLEKFGLPPEVPACFIAYSVTLGYPIAGSVARAQLTPGNLPEEPTASHLRCAALYSIERGLVDRAEELIGRIRETLDPAASGQVTAEGEREAVLQELRGYRAWKEGDLARAARLLGRSNEAFNAGAIWRGDLFRDRGELERAEGWYRAAWRHPLSYQRLGQLYEEMSRPREAAAAYRRFIEAWQNADEELQPRVETARKRLHRIIASEEASRE